MPFMPILMPALGLSILKTAARTEGWACDVFYGSFEFLKMAMARVSPHQAMLDYSFISTAEDLGEVFFAHTLWPGVADRVAEVLADIPTSPFSPFPADDVLLMSARLLELSRRADEFIGQCITGRDWSQYDVVGFSSTFSQNVASICLAREIKKRTPSTRIVFGGANCDGEMGAELLRSFPWIDYVISGEADVALADYLSAESSGGSMNKVAGLHRRLDSGAIVSQPPQPISNIADVPEPDFSDYFEQRTDQLEELGSLSLPVELSRGCWWGAIQHCVFCGLNPTGLTFRSREPIDAVAALRHSASRWGITSIMLVDNIIDINYFVTVLPELVGSGLSIFCETKSNLREDQVALFQRAGVTSIQPGIESLNTAALAHMHKGARAATQLELLKWCLTYGVKPLWFYLYGFPGEDVDWYWNDIALISRLVHLPPPGNPNPVVIDRYSPLFRNPREFGLTNLRPAWNADLIYAGLDDPARFHLSYHFGADLPQATVPEYEVPLWEAVDAWQQLYRQGAFLTQEVGDETTLIVDGRHPDRHDTYLLCGTAHELYRQMRTAQPRISLSVKPMERVDKPSSSLSARDLELTIRGAMAGARLISVLEAAVGDGKGSVGLGVDDFLAELDAAQLIAAVDGRWLALAVDKSGPR